MSETENQTAPISTEAGEPMMEEISRCSEPIPLRPETAELRAVEQQMMRGWDAEMAALTSAGWEIVRENTLSRVPEGTYRLYNILQRPIAVQPRRLRPVE
ncbi:hypothetical protein [Plantibacter sp. CFBP 13570]|uniref:hypothetical protein n=1 Tax=Plantibacter sp. CFBP 13570 TaxID=2775272 RepID=UPI001930E222|nr:hypothetical protein [Plantibacter sp. CFBP 13570]MBD8535653.1 hypothetical protein [Plantibacter sp. CFBP 13570]